MVIVTIVAARGIVSIATYCSDNERDRDPSAPPRGADPGADGINTKGDGENYYYCWRVVTRGMGKIIVTAGECSLDGIILTRDPIGKNFFWGEM
jgi:hypothetical protein